MRVFELAPQLRAKRRLRFVGDGKTKLDHIAVEWIEIALNPLIDFDVDILLLVGRSLCFSPNEHGWRIHDNWHPMKLRVGFVDQRALTECATAAGDPCLDFSFFEVIRHISHVQGGDAIVGIDIFDADDQISVSLNCRLRLLDQCQIVLAKLTKIS